ncbi:hypothetical protein [Shimia sp. Alg240-R146]|uniref:hypothetical protein n=1 Tax=Shimia sp. Alg240-R146 TaxID=2993449 RepID=UPI0022E2C208|nr:hypothetical protein [Shimia sp. Alg240-R146]
MEPSAAPQPSPLPQDVSPPRSELDVAPDPTITARPPTAVSPVTEADQATLTAQETSEPRIVEKTIERVIEKPAASPADSPSPAQRKPITAASASKIGDLPVRRRVHSVFGIRRA